MDLDEDHEINQEEFVGTVMHLRQKILEDFSIGNARFGGLIDAGLKLESFFDSRHDDSMLPLRWSHSTTFEHLYIRQYKHELFGSAQVTPPLQRNFTMAAIIATKYCAPQIANARRVWRSKLLEMSTGDSAEYTTSLDSDMKVATKFHFFDAENESEELNFLDRFKPKSTLSPLKTMPSLQNILFPN